MIGFQYLEQGLRGLANAHRASEMAGHLGAALVAGYAFSEDLPDLSDAVYRGVERELGRIVGGEESFWWNQKQTGITADELFKPLPDEPADERSIDSIATALSRNIGQTRQSGHNVIFAALAIRALHDHPEFATPGIVDGIRLLTARFDKAVPGRGYYGKADGWTSGQNVKIAPDDSLTLYRDESELAEVTIDELIASASLKRQGFGGLWHLINHAAGLVELSRFGYPEVARQGFAAHLQHLRLWRSLPDVESELGAMTKSRYDPREAAYWDENLKRDEARLTHRIKTLYGFFVLAELIEDSGKRSRADDCLRYLMA